MIIIVVIYLYFSLSLSISLTHIFCILCWYKIYISPSLLFAISSSLHVYWPPTNHPPTHRTEANDPPAAANRRTRICYIYTCIYIFGSAICGSLPMTSQATDFARLVRRHCAASAAAAAAAIAGQWHSFAFASARSFAPTVVIAYTYICGCFQHIARWLIMCVGRFGLKCLIVCARVSVYMYTWWSIRCNWDAMEIMRTTHSFHCDGRDCVRLTHRRVFHICVCGCVCVC